MSIRFAALFLAALCLSACGSSNTTPASPTPTPTGGTTSVSMVSGARSLTTTAYSPNPLTVSVGTTVTWINNDTSTHTSTADNGAFATGSIAPGASASIKLQSAGTFAYHCAFHPGMVATITVQ